MISKIRIKNLILIDQIEISFDKGLNIITGETGSGKSVILTAIRLITGARADTDLIGKNGSVAVIEAEIFPYILPDELAKPQDGEPLLLRREIHLSGKNRCFASDQQISLITLRTILGTSIEIVDQSTSHLLSSIEKQREVVDTYCAFDELKSLTRSLVEEKNELSKKLNTLSLLLNTKDRDINWAREDLALIQKINWERGEEELLHKKHAEWIQSQRVGETLTEISHLLDLRSIHQAVRLLEKCKDYQEQSVILRNALREIGDVEQSIHAFLNEQEFDGNALQSVDERLTNIEQLKRRFGKTWEQVEEKKEELSVKISKLENLDFELEETQKNAREKEAAALVSAAQLSKIREEKCPHLSRAILETLRDLNLSNAHFEIALTKTPLTIHGIDQVQFLFSANSGQAPVPIENSASGGEVSRLLFSIKVALSAKDQNECLIFDEIDANVGGLTATVLGKRLKKIAMSKQVICVTHFAQVAQFADQHFVVFKEDAKGQTFTRVKTLEKGSEEHEYARMQGALSPPRIVNNSSLE